MTETAMTRAREIAWHDGHLAGCVTCKAVVARVAAELGAQAGQTEHRACPCLHTTPCRDRCTCVNPFSSSGCLRCCSYGSADQQRMRAEHFVREAAQTRALRDQLELLLLAVERHAKVDREWDADTNIMPLACDHAKEEHEGWHNEYDAARVDLFRTAVEVRAALTERDTA